MNESIFKAYDIRGIYPTDINEDVVKKIAPVCLDFFDDDNAAGKKLIVIAHDGRHGSVELAAAARASILEDIGNAGGKKNSAASNQNITVEEVGLATTPMFYYLVNHFKAAGGIMITASHNPKEYNGLKVVRRGAEMIAGTDLLAEYKKRVSSSGSRAI